MTETPDRAKNTRMPLACELCKDWPRMIELVREKQAFASKGATVQDGPDDREEIERPEKPVRAAEPKKKKDKIAECLHCHKVRKILARGLCGEDYWHFYTTGELDRLYPKLPLVPRNRKKTHDNNELDASGGALKDKSPEKKPFRRHDHAPQPEYPAEITGITLCFTIPVSSIEEAGMAMQAVSTALSYMRRTE